MDVLDRMARETAILASRSDDTPVKEMNDVNEARTDYNGWRNRQTWNCALWIGNDEPLYRAAVRFMGEYKGRTPYKQFICSHGLYGERTPDNIAWLSSRLSYAELNAFMRELV